MINSYDSAYFRISQLNDSLTNVSDKINSQSKLTKGSDDSLAYNYVLGLQNDMDIYTSIKTSITNSDAYNKTSDTALSSAKDEIEFVLQKLIAANNTFGTEDDTTYADDIKSAKETLLTIANTKVDDKYIFSGVNTNTEPFSTSSTGVVSYVSSNTTRTINTGENNYSEIGINGLDAFYYKNQDVASSANFTFAENEVILDEAGQEWKLLDTDNDGTYDGLFLNADATSTPIAITDNGDGTFTSTNSTTGSFEVRHSLFDDLDKVEAALNKKDTSGNDITESDAKNILSDIQDKVKNEIYNNVNDAHNKVGSRTATIDTYESITSAKLSNLNELYTKNAGLTSDDLTELATDLTAIKQTMETLYSVIVKTNDLSLSKYL